MVYFQTFQVDAKGGLSKKLFVVAYGRRLSAIRGSWFGAWGLEKLLWNLLVFRKVRAVLGGQIRFLLSGGAPLSGETQRFINICVGLVQFWFYSIHLAARNETLYLHLFIELNVYWMPIHLEVESLL